MIPKFKAWDKKHKRMWQFADIDSEHGCVSFAYDLNGESYESMGGTEPEEDLVPLQFIGEVDKNKKEIYMGDILKRGGEWAERIGNVNYRDDRAAFAVNWFYGPEYTMNGNAELNLVGNEAWKDEVIGNIYENPELFPFKNES